MPNLMKTTTKLPFKNYSAMDKTLIYKLGCADVYRAFVLSLTTDKESNKTDTTIAQLAGFIKESENNYLQVGKKDSFTNKIKATGSVTITSSRSTSLDGSKSVTRNTYTFLKGNEFRMIGIEFYHLDLEIKLKGYLIKLFMLANSTTLRLERSANDIYKECGVSRATQKKYNAVLIEKGLLEVTENGFILNVEGFNATEKKIKPTKETMALFEDHKMIVESHIMAYNARRKHSGKITEINRDNLNLLLQEGLDRKSYMVALYAMNNFDGIKDINKLFWSIEFGKPQRKAETFTFTI